MGSVPRIPEDPGLPPLHASPVRILVQTLTHLVPSDGVAGDEDPYSDRLISMLDRICKHTWNVEFEPGAFRWYTYGDEFGYNNRPCFFLVDYGNASNDDDVPVISYEWTGEEFKPMPELLQSKDVQDELKELPFTPQPYEQERAPVRETVRTRLRRAQGIPMEELHYMKEHPEDMAWLERKVKPGFWSQFLAQLNSHYKAKEEEKTLQSLHVTTTICKLIIVDFYEDVQNVTNVVSLMKTRNSISLGLLEMQEVIQVLCHRRLSNHAIL
ncbi:hypothetical protein RU639_000378 [Aspergillus parasiticus]